MTRIKCLIYRKNEHLSNDHNLLSVAIDYTK